MRALCLDNVSLSLIAEQILGPGLLNDLLILDSFKRLHKLLLNISGFTLSLLETFCQLRDFHLIVSILCFLILCQYENLLLILFHKSC